MTTARDIQVALNDAYDALELKIKGKVCATCDSYPRVVWIRGEFRIRCNCWPTAPVLESAFKRETRGRT